MTFDREKFYAAINAERIARSLGWSELAEEAGVSLSTLTRMKSSGITIDTLVALLDWSGLKMEDYCDRQTSESSNLARIVTLIHSDAAIDHVGAEVVEAIVTAAYERFIELGYN